MTVTMLETTTLLEKHEETPRQELFTLSPDEINRFLEQVAARSKPPADPCIIEGVSEGFSDEPVTEYQDSCDSAGLYYW